MRRCLVLGCAEGAFVDAVRALRLCDFDAVYATNNIGGEWPGPIASWVTLHPEMMSDWIEVRRGAGYPDAGEVVAHSAKRPCVTRVTRYQWHDMQMSGGSGLFAAKVAIEDGFDRIVLAGVPMDRVRAHYYDAKPWAVAMHFRKAWIAADAHIRPFVRSMSGWTRDRLGSPTPEWLGAAS